MPRHSQILEILRDKDYRLTPQRAMILAVIAERGGHIGAEEIYQGVRQIYPYIDMATIYRTLKLLKKLHLITEIDMGTMTRYELVGERHHHLVCQGCRATIDLPPSYLESLKQDLTQQFGFLPSLEHFTLSGWCRNCQEKGKGVS